MAHSADHSAEHSADHSAERSAEHSAERSAEHSAERSDQPLDDQEVTRPDDDWLRHGRSFGSVAQAYARLRPGYPSDVVEFVVGGPTEQPSRHTPLRVLDLGAGTGKLTDLFLAAGHHVIAVDPAVEMLSQLSLSHPEVSTAVGTAESIPLPDDAVDVLIAGQAAHWFDLETAVPEIARVLRPNGVLGLIWNLRDEQVAWVAALGELMAAEGSSVSRDLDAVAGDAAERLGWNLKRAEFGYAQVLTPDDVVAGLATPQLRSPAGRRRTRPPAGLGRPPFGDSPRHGRTRADRRAVPDLRLPA